MSSTLTYKCPNCDAGLVFDAEKQRFACEFCLSDFSEAELTDTEAARREREAENEEFSHSVNGYRCSSCGAEIIADKSTVADLCYYCHNPIVMTGEVTGVERPAKIVPFRFDKEEAKNIFLRFAKKKWFVPRDYFAPEQTDKISGVYYPFWVVDADSTASLSAKGVTVSTWRQGNYRYTKTSYFAVKRSGAIHFEDVTASAISSEDRAMLEGILPYPLNEHIDFSIPYLQGYTAKKKDIERDSLTSEIRGRMTGYSEQLLMNTVSGYSSVTERNTALDISKSHWDYTLLPIWILTYIRKGKTFTYAMNGATGKIYGELPISGKRLGFAAALAGLLVGIISFLIGWGMM